MAEEPNGGEAVSVIYNVELLDYTISSGSLNNVVTKVTYNAIKTSSSNTAVVHKEIELLPPSGNFINYEELHEATVLQWVLNTLGDTGVANIEAELDTILNTLDFPTTGSGIPWLEA